MVDLGFPGADPNPKGGANLLFGIISAAKPHEKKNWTGGVHPSCPRDRTTVIIGYFVYLYFGGGVPDVGERKALLYKYTEVADPGFPRLVRQLQRWE